MSNLVNFREHLQLFQHGILKFQVRGLESYENDPKRDFTN